MLWVQEQLLRQRTQQVPLDNLIAAPVCLSTQEEFFQLWHRLQELFRQLPQVVLAQRQKPHVFQAKEHLLIQRREVCTAQIQDLTAARISTLPIGLNINRSSLLATTVLRKFQYWKSDRIQYSVWCVMWPCGISSRKPSKCYVNWGPHLQLRTLGKQATTQVLQWVAR